MAFNPFNAFRKHQKVWFAGLTIVCMIVFILQFGSGDIFQRLMGHGPQGKGDKVATLYGRDVYQSDLTRLGQIRSQVNQIYVAGPVYAAMMSVMEDLEKEQDAAEKAKADKKDQAEPPGPDESSSVKLVLTDWKEWNQPHPGLTPQYQMMLNAQQSREMDKDLQIMAQERQNTKSDEVRRKIDAVAAVLRFRFWAMNPKPGEQQRFFFGGSTDTVDLLDFEIWKYQADRLGIVLTKADVRKEVAWDAAGSDVLPKGPWKDDAAFKPYVVQEGRVTGGLTEDEFLTAIADEYRVSIARTLLMGHAAGVRAVVNGEPGSPDPVAPFDFYTFYRDNRTTLKAAFLALPVESFVGKVTKEPSEDELRRLFDKYKDALPEPMRALPAFKEPRRVEIAYVAAKADSPFYKDLASRTEADRLAALQLLAAGTAQTGAGAAASWANLAYGPHELDDTFLNQYASYVSQNSAAGDLWVDPLTNRPAELHDPSGPFGRHPEASVATLGLLLGGSLSPTGPLAAPVGAVGVSALYEEKDRIVRGVVALAGQGALGHPVAAAVLAVPSLPASPPPAMVADKVWKQLHDQEAPRLALQNLNTFMVELTKLRGRPDEAQKYVDKAVEEFGFEKHAMDRPKDVYDLAADPALKELRDAYVLLGLFSRGAKPDLAQDLTAETGAFDPKRISGQSGVVPDFKVPANIEALQSDPRAMQELQQQFQTYQQALSAWMQSPNRFVFWRPVDERAHELGYDQARPEVVRAWKFQEARKLALAEANRINAEAQSQASPLEAVKYLRDQKAGEVFELAGVSRLVSPPTANPGVSHPYVRYAFQADKIAYPPSDLLDRLMGLEKPGETLIFEDQPQKEFYVTVLEERAVPGVKDKDFLDAFSDATQPEKKQLWDDFFVAGRERDYQHKLMRQLRAEAGPIDEATGNLIVSTTKQEQRTPQDEPPPPNPADNSHGGDLGF